MPGEHSLSTDRNLCSYLEAGETEVIELLAWLLQVEFLNT